MLKAVKNLFPGVPREGRGKGKAQETLKVANYGTEHAVAGVIHLSELCKTEWT
jgi:hypothetical protein